MYPRVVITITVMYARPLHYLFGYIDDDTYIIFTIFNFLLYSML